jgi:hypothetical protein
MEEIENRKRKRFGTKKKEDNPTGPHPGPN